MTLSSMLAITEFITALAKYCLFSSSAVLRAISVAFIIADANNSLLPISSKDEFKSLEGLFYAENTEN